MKVKPNSISSKDDENVRKLQKEVLYLKEILNLRRIGSNVNDVHQKFLKLQTENENLRKDHISIREVEALIQENRRMKSEIQHIYMRQSSQVMTTQLDESILPLQLQTEISNTSKSPSRSENRSPPSMVTENPQKNQQQGMYYIGSNFRRESQDNLRSSSVAKSHFFPSSVTAISPNQKMILSPPPGLANKSLNSILPKYFSINAQSTSNINTSNRNNQSLSMGLSSSFNQPSQRHNYSAAYSSNTPVKIRVRGRQEYEIQDGFIQVSAIQIQEQQKKKQEKQRIIERLDQLERIQRYNQDKLHKEIQVIEAIDRNSTKKFSQNQTPYTSSSASSWSSQSNIKPKSISHVSEVNVAVDKLNKSGSQQNMTKAADVGILLEKQQKQLKNYEQKIKQLERRYYTNYK